MSFGVTNATCCTKRRDAAVGNSNHGTISPKACVRRRSTATETKGCLAGGKRALAASPHVHGAPEGSSRVLNPRAHAEQRTITALLMAKIDELRAPLDLSLEGLAEMSGVSMWTLQSLRSEHADPRLTTVLRLCRGLGVTAGKFLGDLPVPVEPRRPGPRVDLPARGADTVTGRQYDDCGEPRAVSAQRRGATGGSGNHLSGRGPM